MQTNANPSELISVVAAVDPDAYTANAYSSGYVDMSDYEQVMAIALCGTMASNGKLDLKFQSNTAASGGTDVTGKAITQLTQAGSDDDKQAIINLRRSELNIDSEHRYVKAVQTVTTAAVDSATLVLGAKEGFNPTNAKMSELISVAGVIDPDANAPGAVSSDWVDIADFHSLLAVVMVGDIGTSCTIAAKLEQATSSGGAGVKDVTGKSITTLDQTASPNPSNQQVTIDCKPEDLDIDNGFRYVRLTVTGVDDGNSPDSTTSDFAGAVLGVYPRSGLASSYGLASVDEIV